jgi:hypothetical protein
VALFAIADIHLSLATEKPMDVFGGEWTDYIHKIKWSWHENIQAEDTVIVAGDISWAMRLEEAHTDLDFLDTLPGQKILLKGNHDYWWSSLSKMQNAWPNFKFLHNNFHIYSDIGICGSRGWLCPGSSAFTPEDEIIYRRELLRVENSLKQARAAGYEKLIGVLHYAPTNEKFEPSGFTELFEAYGVTHVIYGHLHTDHGFKAGLTGTFRGVDYHLVSADFRKFKPLRMSTER